VKPGHIEAQTMFLQIGEALGYRTRRTWSRQLPTDGVWLLPEEDQVLPALPAVALEVAVSEGPKAIKGSLDTLAEISPALGVLVINDAEIRRSAIRQGVDPTKIQSRIRSRFAAARERVARHQQHFEIWSHADLLRRYHLAVGATVPPVPIRSAA
jgi:hypothetical protein